MDDLGQYLRDSFYEHKRQVETINRLVAEVCPVFVNFWDGDHETWPYELRMGTDPVFLGFSNSTTSMILFTLASLLGDAKQTILLPALRKWPGFSTIIGQGQIDETKVRGILDAGATGLMRKLRKMKGKKTKGKSPKKSSTPAYLTRSETYGIDDPFTLTWIAELIRTRTDSTSEIVRANVTKAARRAIDRLTTGDSQLEWLRQNGKNRALDHAFIKLRGMHLYKYLRENDPNNQHLNRVASKMVEFFQERLHQHLSYYTVPDSRFDPAELAFCLEGSLIYDKNHLGMRVTERVFTVLSEYQEINPYWRPLAPFVGNERGMALFPISVEAANSLLRSATYVDDSKSLHNTIFERFMPRFRRYSDWLQARIVRGITTGDRKFVGWHSEHVGEPGTIHLWETSQVILYLMHYAALLQEQAASTALVKSSLSVKTSINREDPRKKIGRNPTSLSELSPAKYWRLCIETEKESLNSGLSRGSPYLTHAFVRQKYIEPRSGTKTGGDFTILMSGPPGTGKTSFCRDLAGCLNWRFINVTVSDFLAGGAAEVEARAKALFEVLKEQTNAVVLMDEIDNFLLDRESRRYQEQEGIFQFMTPGMLTKLAEFREARGSILVVATNYAERIDAAIKRPGRFDHQLVLLPPDSDRRRQIIKDLITKAKLDAERVDQRRLDELVRNTALFAYGELKLMADTALRAPAQASDPGATIEALLSASAKIRPAISLTSYRTRIEAGSRRGKVSAFDRSTPMEEFFLLTHLLHESGRQIDDDERSVITAALRTLNYQVFRKDRVPEAKAAHLSKLIGDGGIRDDKVSRAVARAVLDWKLVTRS